MSCSVADLHAFYQSPLGNITKPIVLNIIKDFWPSAQACAILGVGYPLPYFNFYHAQNKRTLVFMPAQQGVIAWPENGPCLVGLVEEDQLPLPDESIDRILLVHCVEHAEQAHHFLREIWRILSPQGRLLVITPNRRGLWARFDNTPFGQGNPYTMGQLITLLNNVQFTPLIQKRGLYTFPCHSKFLLTLSALIEKIGAALVPKFSGLLAVECTKQIYALPPIPQREIITFPSLLGAPSSQNIAE